MASLLQENRVRLQQRISQRLRGDIPTLTSQRDILTQKFVPPRRRRNTHDQPNTDPFRLQAQEYMYQDVPLSERWYQSDEDHGHDEFRLPVFKPRYTEMHTHKGVPSQKYVDVILDRKGPMHRGPSRYVKGGNILMDRKYDDSMTIRSYRQLDSLTKEPHRSYQEDQQYGRIMLIAPQKIQYSAHGSNRLYTLDKSTSPIKHRMQPNNVDQVKGTRFHTLKSIDEQNEITTVPNRRNVTVLKRIRKRLHSADRKFVKDITQESAGQRFLNSNNSNLMLRGKDANPLPPIRITVTNPLPEPPPPSPSPEAIPNETSQRNTFVTEENQTNAILLKLSHTKRKRKKKSREDTKVDENVEKRVEEKPEKATIPKQVSEPLTERKQSDNGNLMPAPITKITFQSYHAGNLRSPQKASNNVQVERITQGGIIATHPNVMHREKLPAVKISNFEMTNNSSPQIVYRKDGSLGPAPPSTNYVQFQKTTRLGGQSRILLALKNRHLAHEPGSIIRTWNAEQDLLTIPTNGGEYFREVPQPVVHETTSNRKLGKIKAMRRSLAGVQNDIIESEIDATKIEIDTVTDEGKSERSFDSDRRIAVAIKQGRSHRLNRGYDSYALPPTLQPPITGFYMGRSHEQYQTHEQGRTRNMATQWSSSIGSVSNIDTHVTPMAPPNTANLYDSGGEFT